MYLSRFYSLSSITIDCYVMFNKQAACSVLLGLDPIRHMLWVYEVTSKTFLEKHVSMELITMTLEFCEMTGISIQEKHYVRNYYSRKSNLTHV